MRSRQFFALKLLSAICVAPRFAVTPPTYPWNIHRRTQPSKVLKRLLGVELDDELLLNRHRQVFAVRHRLHLSLEALLVDLEPLRNAAAVDGLDGLLNAEDLLALLVNFDVRAGANRERRNVH